MLGHILYFIEGPLLQVALYGFAAGVLVRSAFFVARITAAGLFPNAPGSQRPVALILARALLPYHVVTIKRPFFASIRYLFHGCLIAVPIWFSGHIAMWEESGLEWYWTPLPDAAADVMTLMVIGLSLFFVFRRLLVAAVRRQSAICDYLVIMVAALPFLSGYLYTHGTLDAIGFFKDYLWYLHLLSGETMLLMIAFMFCVTRLREDRCVGCAACTLSCPTGTLQFADQGQFRVFSYSHYQCICCGSCVKACPEGAAELHHEVAFARFFQVVGGKVIRKAKLLTCEMCGAPYAPEWQLKRIDILLREKQVKSYRMNCCSRCKKKITSGKRAYSREAPGA